MALIRSKDQNQLRKMIRKGFVGVVTLATIAAIIVLNVAGGTHD